MVIGQQMMWLGGFNDLFSPLEVNDYLIKQFLVQDRIIASSPEDCSVYLSVVDHQVDICDQNRSNCTRDGNTPRLSTNAPNDLGLEAPIFLCVWIHVSCVHFPGLDKIEFLQSHENQEIYQKAFDLIEHYFGVEEEDASLAPQVDQSQGQFIFQQQEGPMEGFQL